MIISMDLKGVLWFHRFTELQLHYISSAFDINQFAHGIFLDYLKVFDIVNQ